MEDDDLVFYFALLLLRQRLEVCGLEKIQHHMKIRLVCDDGKPARHGWWRVDTVIFVP